MAAKVKGAAGAVERILLPRLNSIDGELKSINTRIDEMDKRMSIRFDGATAKMGELDKRLTAEIRGLSDGVNTKMGELDKRLTAEIRGLSEKVDLVKDVEKLKVEVAELKRRR